MHNYDLHNAQSNLNNSYCTGSGYNNVGTWNDIGFNYNIGAGYDRDYNVGAGYDRDYNIGAGYNKDKNHRGFAIWNTDQERIIPNDNKFLGYYIHYHKY